LQSQATLKKNSGVHARKHRHAAAWFDRQISQIKVLHEFLIGFQQFVGD
jgi:hypothetical protein